MKKPAIQTKIGFLLVLAVILISAIIILSYRNLSSAVSSIRMELTPELRLDRIQNISRDLENAENSIRLFYVTRDSSDLEPYYSVIKGLDGKVNRLRKECAGDSNMIFQIDTISSLIEENIINWNRILYLVGSDYTINFLTSLSDKVNDNPLYNEDKSILKRVFSRNSKKLEEEKELINNLKKVEEEEMRTRQKLKGGESKLAATNSILHDKIFELISRMETQSAKRILEKGRSASKLTRTTNTWVLFFSITGGLLAIVVLFLIIRYLKYTHSYQIALEKSKHEAENLARAKELFLANISHEIRTPVTAISGFTEQLLHEVDEQNLLKSLKIIKSSSDHLARIIDDILDLSKLQNRKLTLENVHFSLPQIMNEVHAVFESRSAQNNTKLSSVILSGPPPALLGDPYRLKQILMNLVGNAVKFTEHGMVEFVIEAVRQSDDMADLILKVNDTGIGIDENKLSAIFEDFTQAEMNTSSRYGGTGLGLSIVKKLVDLYGGTITCESKMNLGTRFTCHLPFHLGDEKKILHDFSLPLNVPDDIRNLNILIVDDEEYNRLLFRKILERWKIRCDETESGMAALEILKKKRYDVVFMDIRMPGIDGINTTRFIREELGLTDKEMQVVCISALSLNDVREKYRKAGITGFLQKPFTEENLLSAIMSARDKGKTGGNEIPAGRQKDIPVVEGKINLSNLLHLSRDDRKFVREMLASFNHTTETGIKELKNAILSEKWKSVADLAHKMLPPCRHIGAKELYDLLEKIETGVRNRVEKKELEDLSGLLILEFDLVRQVVEKEISRLH